MLSANSIGNYLQNDFEFELWAAYFLSIVFHLRIDPLSFCPAFIIDSSWNDNIGVTLAECLLNLADSKLFLGLEIGEVNISKSELIGNWFRWCFLIADKLLYVLWPNCLYYSLNFAHEVLAHTLFFKNNVDWRNIFFSELELSKADSLLHVASTELVSLHRPCRYLFYSIEQKYFFSTLLVLCTLV